MNLALNRCGGTHVSPLFPFLNQNDKTNFARPFVIIQIGEICGFPSRSFLHHSHTEIQDLED